MKFICDVHISYKVQKFLQSQGHIAVHINEVLNKWNTKDIDICRYADEHDCVVITKDFDFLDFYYIRKSPRKLIKINLGNIATDVLIQIISEVLPHVQKVIHRSNFLIEVDKNKFLLDDENIEA